ncbi:MAG TPA: hypothetical protein EYP49_20810 [Anaerolineae bacterium]|nr:hypothetical protein [Anaerolineae bacterium]
MQTDRIWQAALGELKLQMTKATFDTWLANTHLTAADGNAFTIAVPNAFTRDWLENRLLTTIKRILVGIAGCPVEVHFVVRQDSPQVVTAEPAAGPQPITLSTLPELHPELAEGSLVEADHVSIVAVQFYEFDPMKRGFLQMPKYCEWFWQPYFGVVTYATYRFLRSLDRQNEGWGGWHFVKVERIAATLGVNRQKITGVQREKDGRKYWQPGAFDALSQAAIARVETLGKGKKVSYKVSCLNSLPLLTPAQVETLPGILQEEHARFLKECSIEYEEWKQLELSTLVQE